MVNAPEGFNKVFFLKHLFNGRKWILLRACYEMSFNSIMYHDKIYLWLQCRPASQQQEQSGQIQNKSEKSMVKWPNTWCNSKNSEGFHHVLDYCCHFPVKSMWLILPRLPIWQLFLVCFSTSISSQLSPHSISKRDRISSRILLSMQQTGNTHLKLQRFPLWSKRPPRQNLLLWCTYSNTAQAKRQQHPYTHT